MPDRSGPFCYEQPLNERVRTFLRLEHLLTQMRYHEHDESNWGRRATLTALLDILTILARHDLRTEISKALGACYARLNRLADRDDVDKTQLQQVLGRLDTLGREIQHVPPQFASYQLRDDELLNSLNNRHAIPGGACEFDIPSFQHWLYREAGEISRRIDYWCQRIAPFEGAINTLLGLMRDGTRPQAHTATQGVLVHQTETGTQLIRVLLENNHVYPEISAGRHRATVRFMEYDGDDLRVRQYRGEVSFQMACCRL